MNVRELLIQCIRQSAANVFTTMLGTELGEGEVLIETSMPEPNDGIVSFIGLAGTWAGTGSLTCSAILACRICSMMLMNDSTSVNEDVLDAVAELTNMIIGSVKTDLEQHLGQLGLSIPTVVYGRNFRTKSAGNSEWIVVRFFWEGEPLHVKLCLTPSESTPLNMGGVHACALEV